MEPFFFGNEGRQLLGLYHPPGGPGTDRGIIICPPILGDYMRTHACLRQLADELARIGFHVLRFDYYGTGDSQGDIQDATIEMWQQDIVSAGDELRDISGVARVTAFGVRLGATMAVMAAAKSSCIDKLHLWDPVTAGQRYLTALNQTYNDLLASHIALPKTDAHQALSQTTGYDLSPDLLVGIEKLRLSRLAALGSAEIAMMLTDKAEFDVGDSRKISSDRLFFDVDCNWDTFTETVLLGKQLVPDIARRVAS